MCETSAKENINVDTIFDAITFKLLSYEYNSKLLYAYTYEQPGMRCAFNKLNLTEIRCVLHPDFDFQRGAFFRGTDRSFGYPGEPSLFFQTYGYCEEDGSSQKLLASNTTTKMLPTSLKEEPFSTREPLGLYGRMPLSGQQITSKRRKLKLILNYKASAEGGLCELCFSRPINTKMSCGHCFSCSTCLKNGRVANCIMCNLEHFSL